MCYNDSRELDRDLGDSRLSSSLDGAGTSMRARTQPSLPYRLVGRINMLRGSRRLTYPAQLRKGGPSELYYKGGWRPGAQLQMDPENMGLPQPRGLHKSLLLLLLNKKKILHLTHLSTRARRANSSLARLRRSREIWRGTSPDRGWGRRCLEDFLPVREGSRHFGRESNAGGSRGEIGCLRLPVCVFHAGVPKAQPGWSVGPL